MSFLDTVHPGARIALARLTMDEVGIARAIAAGELSSPQYYGTFWLFAIRITGTGTAFRPMLSEIVYRPPEHYLTEDFLARCNGLPVILEHPESNKKNDSGMLNTKEYKKRVIGAIMLSYIVGNEVWGIARINDDNAAKLMLAEDLSTSPGVSIRPIDGDSMELKLAGGGTIFFEGKPYLVDHIAICSLGVWDKGGDPLGVRVENRSDLIMPGENETEAEKKAREEKERADKARLDAEPRQMLETLDAFRKSISDTMDKWRTDFSGRLDALEDGMKKRGDTTRKDNGDGEGETPAEKEAREKKEAAEVAEAEKNDKARKDAEEEAKKEKERADALASQNGDLVRRVAALESRTPLSPEHADYNTMIGFQSRADRSYSLHGLSAPRPMEGETAVAYRRRLAVGLKKHSPDYKDIDIGAVSDENMLTVIEKRVYDDAEKAARNPVDIGAGELRKITRTDEMGRRITEYHGDPMAWMEPFRLPFRNVLAIHRNPDGGTRAA